MAASHSSYVKQASVKQLELQRKLQQYETSGAKPLIDDLRAQLSTTKDSFERLSTELAQCERESGRHPRKGAAQLLVCTWKLNSI